MDQEQKVEEPKTFSMKLKDFSGSVVREMTLKAPLPFPYLIYNNRLFVTSRDTPFVLLERSFCVLMDDQPPPKDSH